MGSNEKKYTKMENILQEINKNYISLQEEEIYRNNDILKYIIGQVINKMKENDVLFKSLYSTVFYGGSFYDGLRVGHPEEFDLDLLLMLPKSLIFELPISNVQGFVHLQLKDIDNFLKQTGMMEKFKSLKKLTDDKGYMSTSAVRAWMQGLITKALNHFPKHGSSSVIADPHIGTFYAKTSSSGPAFTLLINGTVNRKNIQMDIDLVPCFVFQESKWPTGGYRQNIVQNKKTFFIVPKSPRLNQSAISGRYWRLSFQEQERELLNGLNTAKPAIKLLKKIRDNLGHNQIASYFIKTVFLWEVEQQKNNPNFWRQPLSIVFMHMFKKYVEWIEKKQIPYFWNKKNNLIGGTADITLANIANRLRRIVQEIDRSDDPFVLVKYILKEDELLGLRTKIGLNVK